MEKSCYKNERGQLTLTQSRYPLREYPPPINGLTVLYSI